MTVVAVCAMPADDRRLVKTMQNLGFGRIENLHIRDGRPVWNPKPRILHIGKPGGRNGRWPDVPTGDFAIKRQVRDLLDYLETKGDGVLRSIDVQDGLPLKWVFEEDDA